MPAADNRFEDRAEAPGRLRDGSPNEHSEQARSTLADADRLAYMLDADHDALFTAVHEEALVATFTRLTQAQSVASRLHDLADAFNVARGALRDRLQEALAQHDAQVEKAASTDTARLVPASASRVI